MLSMIYFVFTSVYTKYVINAHSLKVFRVFGAHNISPQEHYITWYGNLNGEGMQDIEVYGFTIIMRDLGLQIEVQWL